MATKTFKAETTTLSSKTSSQTALAARTARISALLVNDSDTTIYLRLGDMAVLNEGIRLNANGGAYEINMMSPWPGSVSFICSAASKVLMITEVYLQDGP